MLYGLDWVIFSMCFIGSCPSLWVYKLKKTGVYRGDSVVRGVAMFLILVSKDNFLLFKKNVHEFIFIGMEEVFYHSR